MHARIEHLEENLPIEPADAHREDARANTAPNLRPGPLRGVRIEGDWIEDGVVVPVDDRR